MEVKRKANDGRFVFKQGKKDVEAKRVGHGYANEMKMLHLPIAILSLIFLSCREDKAEQPFVEEAAVKTWPKIELTSEQLDQEIDKVVIWIVDLRDVELESALHFLVQRGSEHHPERGFRFPFDFSGVDIQSDVTISWVAEKIPLREAITTICEKGNLEWENRDGTIVVWANEKMNLRASHER